MRKQGNNYAFIDSQNVNLAIRGQGWKLDWKRFRIYLTEQYGVTEAFLFIGFIEGNAELYTALQRAGFVCIFKPTLVHANGGTKGNCDAELVLQAMIEYSKYDKAIVVTGDGDFHCLAKYLAQKNKLGTLLIPDRFKFSALLRFRMFRPYLQYMNDLQALLAYKKERPRKDGTLRGNLSRS